VFENTSKSLKNKPYKERFLLDQETKRANKPKITTAITG